MDWRVSSIKYNGLEMVGNNNSHDDNNQSCNSYSEEKPMISYSIINNVWWVHYHTAHGIISKKMIEKPMFESVRV